MDRIAHLPLPAVALWLLAAAIVATREAPAAQPADIRVDARELPRKLVETVMTWRASPGRRAFLYPRWVQGTHSPGGPVQNLGGLAFETKDGKALAWTRDEADPWRFECTVPPGVDRVVVRTRYICNQPSVNSGGADCYGYPLLGVINWNTLILYPEGSKVAETDVSVELRLPEGWKHGTALQGRQTSPGTTRFETVTLDQLVDSPLIAGRHFRAIQLTGEGAAVPHVLEVVAGSEAALQLPEELVEQYRRVVTEAGVLFGRYPYDRFHFLLTLSDELGNTGLEHSRSSLNGVKERALSDMKDIEPWVAYLLPHEYVHSWCGKWRRPKGMVTDDFHQPLHTSLLWIYEGLTQYLGDVLAARAGLVEAEDFRIGLARDISSLMHQKGRRWRPLQDTAASSWLLRSGSSSWGLHRRSQDYYDEGALIWMEADALIRRETSGKRSLDDFCRAFLGAEKAGQEVLPYELADVVAALNAVHAHDWKAFLATRVERTQEELPLEFVTSLGWRLQYGPERPAQVKKREERAKSRDFTDSLGCSFREGGAILRIVPGSPADRAGLFEGVEVLGVDSRKFTLQRMEDAIAGSVASRGVKLLVAEGDVLRDVVLDYADGLKYLSLARDESQPDRIADIIKARVPAKEAKPAK